jgi:hypothetical protein
MGAAFNTEDGPEDLTGMGATSGTNGAHQPWKPEQSNPVPCPVALRQVLQGVQARAMQTLLAKRMRMGEVLR